MALEAATYISGLVPSNPVGATDDLSTADDHLRLIKSTILNTFPGINGEVSATQAQLNRLHSLAGQSLLAKADAGAGEPEALTASSNDTILRRTGNALNFGQLTAGMFPAEIVSNAMLRHSSALSVIGRSANSEGDPADIAAGTDGHILRRSGTSLGFGTIAAGAFPATLNIGSTALTVSTLNGTDPSNFAVLNAANNVFTASSASDGGIAVSSSTPRFHWFEDDQDADGKRWSAVVVGGTWQLRATADDGSGTNSAIDVARSGTTITGITLGANVSMPAASMSGNLTMSGTRTIDATTRLNLTGSTVSVAENGGSLGFFGGAGATKPSVGGIRAELSGPTALNSLINALANLGLITDNTTAP